MNLYPARFLARLNFCFQICNFTTQNHSCFKTQKCKKTQKFRHEKQLNFATELKVITTTSGQKNESLESYSSFSSHLVCQELNYNRARILIAQTVHKNLDRTYFRLFHASSEVLGVHTQQMGLECVWVYLLISSGPRSCECLPSSCLTSSVSSETRSSLRSPSLLANDGGGTRQTKPSILQNFLPG